jgi:hypothetical protein
MKQCNFIAADEGLIAKDTISYVDTGPLVDKGYISIYHDGWVSRVSGFFALEAVMLLKPGALEGKRLRWPKRVWMFHNVVAHPLMQFLTLAGDLTKPIAPSWSCGLYKAAIRLHDATVPTPTGFRDKKTPVPT